MKAVPSLVERVRATIERHGMFRAGQRVGVAVSGGADSVCLLEVLRELAPEWNLSLTVLHLDHGLRGEESRRDAEFVAQMAARLGLPVVVRRADLQRAAGNLEEAGREARLQFFRQAMAAGTVERVALGHTRRDQAETVLFRILRGSGTAGLAGIRPMTAEGLVRPLIETGREQVEEYLRARGIGWREDATNTSMRFARNRIRHGLMPQLAREWNPQIEATLAHMGEWARAEEAYWEEELERSWRCAPEADGSVVLRRGRFVPTAGGGGTAGGAAGHRAGEGRPARDRFPTGGRGTGAGRAPDGERPGRGGGGGDLPFLRLDSGGAAGDAGRGAVLFSGGAAGGGGGTRIAAPDLPGTAGTA